MNARGQYTAMAQLRVSEPGTRPWRPDLFGQPAVLVATQWPKPALASPTGSSSGSSASPIGSRQPLIRGVWLRRRGWATPESGIDLVVIAPELSTIEAQAHFKPTGCAVRRPVNLVVFSSEACQAAHTLSNPFVRKVLAGSLIPLVGELRELGEEAIAPASRATTCAATCADRTK